MPPNSHNTISPDMLARAGRSLYGNQWQTALARDLNMSDRLLRYMAAGERRISNLLAAKLINVVARHRDNLSDIANELRMVSGLSYRKWFEQEEV